MKRYANARSARLRWRFLVVTFVALASVLAGSLLPAAKAMALTPGDGAPTPVYRWWQNSDKDWVTIPAHGTQPSDSNLTSASYTKTTTPQYYVSMIKGSDPNMVAVNRWWHASDKDWIDVTEGSISDATLGTWGYTNKKFQYYLYSTSGTNKAAVNRWWSAADKDWITLRQDEISDSTLTGWGYTSKTLLGYAYTTQSPSGEMGYFNLTTPQASVVPTSYVSGFQPHTMSVLDVNPTLSPSVNNGYRYIAYYGHNDCGGTQGIYIARSNDLNASTWVQDPTPPSFTGTAPCRWASALVDGSDVALVVDQVWGSSITAQVSTDGLNGTTFGSTTTLVQESGVHNGNPTLFKDPNTGTYYLYWFRHIGSSFEIRVKSASTFAGLVGSGPTDLGTLVAVSSEETAAPQVMYYGGRYYLAVETHESQGGSMQWRTRVLTSTSPTSGFYEIPAGPVYAVGVACVFQHVVGNTLHSYYCQEHPGGSPPWSLDHTTADLTNPN